MQSVDGRLPDHGIEPGFANEQAEGGVARRRHAWRPGTNDHDMMMPGQGHLDRLEQRRELILQLEKIDQEDKKLIVSSFAHSLQQGLRQYLDLACRGKKITALLVI